MEKEDQQTTITIKRKTRNLLSRMKDAYYLKSFDEVITLLHNTSTMPQKLKVNGIDELLNERDKLKLMSKKELLLILKNDYEFFDDVLESIKDNTPKQLMEIIERMKESKNDKL